MEGASRDEGSPRGRVAGTVEGVHHGHFRWAEWWLMAINSVVFGSAFLWIAVALRSVHPGTLAFGRLALGAGVLALFPSARVRIARRDRMRMAVAGLFGSAAPALLFALAEQRISSALAGMLISAVPVATAILVAAATRAWPAPSRVLGLVVGSAGVVLLTAPDLAGAGGQPLGVALVVVAVLCYAVAGLLYAPLQHTYGALPVTLWTLTAAALLLLPVGVAGLPTSRFEAFPVVALLILGVVGTGLVWAAHLHLLGRVGAVRSSAVGYGIPLVALLLGVVALDERVVAVQGVGVVVALIGGWLISRGRPGH